MSEPCIIVEHLAKEFKIKQKAPGFRAGWRSLWHPEYKEIKAVDDISFSINQGELVAFIGPNGAGKSTTIKMLTGILYPTSGSLTVLGYNPQAFRQQLAYEIGTVFGQKPQLWYHLPPQDTFDLYSKIYELDEKMYRDRLKYLVEKFEIEELLKTPVRKLSLGQRMRCEIVASFLHHPKIIFLDEPTIGLDVIAKQTIREVIQHLNKTENTTILLTSHDAGDVEALAERTIVINHGKIIFDDTTEQLKKRFIKNKIVEIVSEKPLGPVTFDGGAIVEKTKFSVKVEFDTAAVSIDSILQRAAKDFSLKDINIYDPPMEEIVAAIYREKKV